MRKSFLTILLGILFTFPLTIGIAIGQNMDNYREYVEKALASYKLKDYKTSAEQFEKAFEANDGKAYLNDRYNAACSHALSKNSERAFFHLNRLTDHPDVKYAEYDHIINDSDLNSLHKNKQWKPLIEKVKKNKEEVEKDYDKPLIAILDTILQEDQKYRRQISEIEKKYGRESEEMESHWELIQLTDSINLIKIKQILDERGWLGANVIGRNGNTTLFLVIQHSSLEVQENYLPMMRKAVQDGNANSSSLAMLEDRVAIGKGGKQIYGSQIGMDQDTGEYFVLPLENPENVDVRRAEVGLGSISDYASNWQIVWDVEKHKERTKKSEEEKEKE